MAIEAAASKYKLKNMKIYIAACIVIAIILGYDGYLSKYEWSKRQSFYQEHVIDNDGKPDGTMAFNRNSPPVFLVVAVIFGVKLAMTKKRRILADENGMDTGCHTIAYDSIEKIDKTQFDQKGYFIVTYKNEQAAETDLKISDRDYDNLHELLDHLIAKIS
jgi:hypothetical protein